MGLVVPFALAPLDVYPVIFFVCIIICNLLYVCPIKLKKKQQLYYASPASRQREFRYDHNIGLPI
jgi:hypothetical protein